MSRRSSLLIRWVRIPSMVGVSRWCSLSWLRHLLYRSLVLLLHEILTRVCWRIRTRLVVQVFIEHVKYFVFDDWFILLLGLLGLLILHLRVLMRTGTHRACVVGPAVISTYRVIGVLEIPIAIGLNRNIYWRSRSFFVIGRLSSLEVTLSPLSHWANCCAIKFLRLISRGLACHGKNFIERHASNLVVSQL
jgi:hypothetical protein